MSLKQLWERDFLIFEFFLSVLLTGIIVIVVYYFSLYCNIVQALDGIRASFYGTIAQIEGALLGFVIAGVSILLTMSESPAMKILKTSPYFRIIYDVFTNSAKYFAISTVTPLVAMLFDKDQAPNLYFTYLVVWCVIISILRLARCLWILNEIIEIQIAKK